MKYVKLENNIIKLSRIVGVTKFDNKDFFNKEKNVYNIALEMEGHEKYIKATYDSMLKRDVAFDRLLRLMHVKEL